MFPYLANVFSKTLPPIIWRHKINNSFVSLFHVWWIYW